MKTIDNPQHFENHNVHHRMLACVAHQSMNLLVIHKLEFQYNRSSSAKNRLLFFHVLMLSLSLTLIQLHVLIDQFYQDSSIVIIQMEYYKHLPDAQVVVDA